MLYFLITWYTFSVAGACRGHKNNLSLTVHCMRWYGYVLRKGKNDMFLKNGLRSGG